MTAVEKSIAKNSKQHTVYKLANGDRVPGTTTIIGILDKPALKFWANKIGLQGIKMGDYVDALADVGTTAHAMILADLSGKGAETALEGKDSDIRTLAENCYLSFLEWNKQHKIEPLALEQILVSEQYRYGGTVDFIGHVDDGIEIIDFKTGGIWPEHFIQLAAYAQLALEKGIVSEPIKRFRILSIPRTETESFDEKLKTSVQVEWQIFEHCLKIYALKKELDKN
jgi:hypothetical protein